MREKLSKLVACRMPRTLKAEIEATARAAGRTFSGECRHRLSQARTEQTIRLAMTAVQAKLPHKQILRLIAAHMERP